MVELAPRPLSTELVAAIEDLCRDLDRYHTRQGRRLNLTRCLEVADQLIEGLGDLVRAGSTAVPAAWQPRLDRFARGLPAGAAVELRAGVEPEMLLDQLIAVEESLLGLQLSDLRARMQARPG